MDSLTLLPLSAILVTSQPNTREGGKEMAISEKIQAPLIMWKRNPVQTGEIAKIGKWVVGGWFWNPAMPVGAKQGKLRTTCRLPGIKPIIGDYETEGQARQRVETAVNVWFAGLKVE